jgi:hypothetical protein
MQCWLMTRNWMSCTCDNTRTQIIGFSEECLPLADLERIDHLVGMHDSNR